ncbi:ammonium transporter [Nannocystis pusilla]|uniref:ammonium transporter n=1 Tax=Nannocystis pusilla TaxID=889268 RepID=UPI003B7CF16C
MMTGAKQRSASRGAAAVVAAAIALAPGLARAGEPVALDTGTTAWMLTSTALVLLMVPGLAMFYGGLVRTKNVLGTMLHSFMAMAIIGVLWTVCGYAMAFGTTIGGVVGWDWDKFMLSGIDTAIMREHAIPEYVYAMFQGKFAIITPALIAGAFAERVSFRGYCLFIALWSLLIYNPLAHIIWGGGFLYGEAIDFAGGTVIHISAGTAALVCAFYLGARRGYPRTAMHPNNMVLTLVGAGLLWVGWFGFNAGSSVSSGLKTAQALTVTQIAAASGALAWMVIELVLHRKATSLGMVSGILAGLVAITPAAGDVLPTGALLLGALASLTCYLAILLKARLGYDDTLDVFGIHGMAGIVGALGLTFFLRELPEHGLAIQLWYQLKSVLLSVSVSAVGTLALLVLVDRTIGIRASAEQERAGIDHSMHGEHGYGFLNPN